MTSSLVEKTMDIILEQKIPSVIRVYKLSII
jgi:hypothetical protein